jgi:hypothetical protein
LISGRVEEWFKSVVENQVRNDQMMTRLEEHQNLPPPEPPASGSALPVNPEHWVEKYGDVLFGFAASRVRDRTIAQDLVQVAPR